MATRTEDGTTVRLIEQIQNGKPLTELLTVTPLASLPELLNKYLGKRGLSTEALFEQAGLNRAFGFKVLNGTRQPSRDTLLRLALVLKISIEETQLLLKCGHHARLTAHDVRDVIVMKALNDHLSFAELDHLLMQCNAPALMEKI